MVPGPVLPGPALLEWGRAPGLSMSQSTLRFGLFEALETLHSVGPPLRGGDVGVELLGETGLAP